LAQDVEEPKRGLKFVIVWLYLARELV